MAPYSVTRIRAEQLLRYRGIARNSFWVGIIFFTARHYSRIYIAAWRHRLQLVHKIIFRDWFWEGIYTDIPLRRYAPAEMGDHLATIDKGLRRGAAVPLSVGELGPHLTQCRLGRRLLSYQVASSSIQLFDLNRHGPKIGGCTEPVPLMVGAIWVPSVPGLFVPKTFSLPRMNSPYGERSFRRLFVPRNFRSRALSFSSKIWTRDLLIASPTGLPVALPCHPCMYTCGLMSCILSCSAGVCFLLQCILIVHNERHTRQEHVGSALCRARLGLDDICFPVNHRLLCSLWWYCMVGDLLCQTGWTDFHRMGKFWLFLVTARLWVVVPIKLNSRKWSWTCSQFSAGFQKSDAGVTVVLMNFK